MSGNCLKGPSTQLSKTINKLQRSSREEASLSTPRTPAVAQAPLSPQTGLFRWNSDLDRCLFNFYCAASHLPRLRTYLLLRELWRKKKYKLEKIQIKKNKKFGLIFLVCIWSQLAYYCLLRFISFK